MGRGCRVRKSRQKEAARVRGGRGFMGIECGGTRDAAEVGSGEGVCVRSESPHGVFSVSVGWWHK